MDAKAAENSHIPLSQDAALVVALAGTAMAFAHSAEDEAERWLRVLRLQGQVGCALQALGVGEAPLMTSSEPAGNPPAGTPPFGPRVVDDVTTRGTTFAVARGAERTGTADLLFAVLAVYDRLFDRVLYLRGTSRDELIERLASTGQPAANGTGH
jgi:hypothetical protein